MYNLTRSNLGPKCHCHTHSLRPLTINWQLSSCWCLKGSGLPCVFFVPRQWRVLHKMNSAILSNFRHSLHISSCICKYHYHNQYIHWRYMFKTHKTWYSCSILNTYPYHSIFNAKMHWTPSVSSLNFMFYIDTCTAEIWCLIAFACLYLYSRTGINFLSFLIWCSLYVWTLRLWACLACETHSSTSSSAF